MRTLPVLLVLLLAACRTTPQLHAPRPVDIRGEAPAGPDVKVLAPEGNVREGAIAISPPDPRIVVAGGIRYLGTNDQRVVVYRSTDGGRTWSEPRPLPLQISGGRTLTGHFDPVLVADRTGTFYATVVGMESATSNWTIVVYRSTDGGATWTGIDVSKTHALVDKPWIAVDNSGGRYEGSVYLIWSALSGGFRIYVSTSRDGGLTWSAPATFPTNGSPMIGVGASGAVHVSHIGSSEAYQLLRSTDGGATFDPPRNVAPFRQPGPLAGSEMGSTLMHQFAADVSASATRGNLYLVYPADTDARRAPASVWFTRSTDDGLTWTEPVRLSSADADAALPSVTVDPLTGDVVLTWLDRRDDPQNALAKLFTSRSTDGGATLESPRALTSPFVAGKGFGDYNQLAAHGGRRLAMFSDGASHLSVATISQTPLEAAPKKRRSARH